jgi:hypothetical protein
MNIPDGIPKDLLTWTRLDETSKALGRCRTIRGSSPATPAFAPEPILAFFPSSSLRGLAPRLIE